MRTTIERLTAFEQRGTYENGLAYIDGERTPEFDMDFECMDRDPECLGKIRGDGLASFIADEQMIGVEHNQRLDVLESIVDRIGVQNTVELLAEICSAKSDHLLENWQDEVTARTWDDSAAELLRARDRLSTY